jgi:ABC-type Fe3+-hydroxamate transport system substrate-binding protein
MTIRLLCACLGLALLGHCARPESPEGRSNLASLAGLPPPTRVVSLAPNMTELLFALGAGPRVVGVTRFCTWPPEAALLEKVGGFTDVSVEKVLSLKPDLVVVATGPGSWGATRALERAGVRVYWSRVDLLEDVARTLRELGGLLGLAARGEARARELVLGLEQGSVPPGTPPVPVLALVGAHPLVAVGGGTFIDQLLERAGGSNVASSAAGAYPTLSEESVQALAPRVILDLSMGSDALPPSVLERWRERGIRLVTLEADLFRRPSARLPQALAGLREAIAPAGAPGR